MLTVLTREKHVDNEQPNMCPQTSRAFVFSNDFLKFQRASLPVQPPTFSNDDLPAALTKRCPRLLALLKRTSVHDDQIASVKVVRLYASKNPNDPWFLIGVGAFVWRVV